MTAELAAARDRVAAYLAGTLPPAEARQLETEFRADPTLGERLGVGQRLARVYRLLEVDRPAEPPPPRWQDRRLFVGGLAALGVLLLALLFVAWRWDVMADRVTLLQGRLERGSLAAASATRAVLVDPEAGSARVTLEADATRVDVALLVRSDRFNVFRVTLERDDGATAFIADRLVRNSNGHLGLSFNTSALPPAGYHLLVDGISYRGERVRLARAALVVDRASR